MRVSLIGGERPEITFEYKGNVERRIKILEMVAEGGNGLVYRAVEEEGINKTVCMIKEYYPEEYNITIPGVEYVRKEYGAPLQISATEERAKIAQMMVQDSVTKREVGITQALFYEDGKDVSNSPYVFKMVRLNELIAVSGDGIYLKIDTTEGKTMKELSKNFPDIRKEPYSAVRDALIYLEKMLVLVDFVSEKGFVHGDLALDNLYVSGDRMMVLDFGSSFRRNEYRVDDFYNEEKIYDTADRINRNITIGASHENSRSSVITHLLNVKKRYKRSPGIENAKALVEAIGKVDVSADIYSCIKIFYQILTGNSFEAGATKEVMYGDKVAEDYISDFIHNIMSINEEMYFKTTEMLRKEIKEMRDIIDRQCTPRALIQILQENLKKEMSTEILPELLPELEVRQLPKV